MLKEQTIGLNNTKILSVVKFIALFGIAILAPLAQNQFITGTIVNAVLYIAVLALGLGSAVAIAFFPSLISLGLGLLPAIMIPMIPFVILGNLILIAIFAWFQNKNFWLSAISASVLKFAWLAITSQFVISFFIQKPVAAKIVAMMSWPQLVTALAGGILAYIVARKIFAIKEA